MIDKTNTDYDTHKPAYPYSALNTHHQCKSGSLNIPLLYSCHTDRTNCSHKSEIVLNVTLPFTLCSLNIKVKVAVLQQHHDCFHQISALPSLFDWGNLQIFGLVPASHTFK